VASLVGGALHPYVGAAQISQKGPEGCESAEASASHPKSGDLVRGDVPSSARQLLRFSTAESPGCCTAALGHEELHRAQAGKVPRSAAQRVPGRCAAFGKDRVSCRPAASQKMKPRADLRDLRGVLGAFAKRQRTISLGSGITMPWPSARSQNSCVRTQLAAACGQRST
jgi:hypothetical protein